MNELTVIYLFEINSLFLNFNFRRSRRDQARSENGISFGTPNSGSRIPKSSRSSRDKSRSDRSKSRRSHSERREKHLKPGSEKKLRVSEFHRKFYK